MSSDRLLNAIISSKPVRKGKKPKILKTKLGEVGREFKKSKHKLNIRDEIKNRKNLFTLETKKTEKSLDELENFLFETKSIMTMMMLNTKE